MSRRRCRDQHGRPLGVMRLSLTARCNLSCSYCKPDGKEAPQLLNQEQQLAVIQACCELGCHTLRLTGGEPLLAPGLLPLLSAIQRLNQAPEGHWHAIRDIALTTNGLLLTEPLARELRQAGLQRLTISLDGLDPEVAAATAGLRGGAAAGQAMVQKVLDALSAAEAAGFDPKQGQLKVNSVIQRGKNEQELLPLAAMTRERGLELRLIEYMDVGQRNGWRSDEVLPAAEMISQLHRRWPLEPMGRPDSGTALQWRYSDGAGVVAAIASISQPFCSDCNRLRITADGIAYTCLFSEMGTDLKPWLNPKASPEALREAIANLWGKRRDRSSEERQQGSSLKGPRAEMAYLGG